MTTKTVRVNGSSMRPPRGCHERGRRTGQLAHHFDTAEQQFESGKLGMWIFLRRRSSCSAACSARTRCTGPTTPRSSSTRTGSSTRRWGAINTAVLICSSFTMALAVRAAQLGRTKALVRLLAATIVLAFCFLGIKASSTSTSGKRACCGPALPRHARASRHNPETKPAPTTQYSLSKISLQPPELSGDWFRLCGSAWDN